MATKTLRDLMASTSECGLDRPLYVQMSEGEVIRRVEDIIASPKAMRVVLIAGPYVDTCPHCRGILPDRESR